MSSTGDVEKTDMFTDDSVSEETIIAEYALVINGHSLVRQIIRCVIFSFVGKIILSSDVLVFILALKPAGFILLNGGCVAVC